MYQSIPNLTLSKAVYNNTVNANTVQGSLVSRTFENLSSEGSTTIRAADSETSIHPYMHLWDVNHSDNWTFYDNTTNLFLYRGIDGYNTSMGIHLPKGLPTLQLNAKNTDSFNTTIYSPCEMSCSHLSYPGIQFRYWNNYITFPAPSSGTSTIRFPETTTGPFPPYDSYVLVNNTATQTVTTPMIFNSSLTANNGLNLGDGAGGTSLMSVYRKTTYTCNFSGPWTTRSTTVYLNRRGRVVTMNIKGPLEATATASAFIDSGTLIPAEYRQTSTGRADWIIPIRNGTLFTYGVLSVFLNTGAIRIMAQDSTTFTSGGTAGLYQSVSVSWTMT
jgi:hypothetical protein